MFVKRSTTKVSCGSASVDTTTFFGSFCGHVCVFDGPCAPPYDWEAPLSFSASVQVGWTETKLVFARIVWSFCRLDLLVLLMC